MKDFEDAIQSTAAELNQLDLILTRNKSDFIGSAIEVLINEDPVSASFFPHRKRSFPR